MKTSRYAVRSAALTSYVPLARSLGLDPYNLLKEAGINRAALLDPDLKIPAEALARMLEASAAEAGVEDFGLRLAATRELSNLGPLALAMREEPTLRRKLEAAAKFQRLHNEALRLRVEEEDGLVYVSEAMLGTSGTVYRQAAELTIGVLHGMMRLFFGEGWAPRAVCFSHQPPRDMAPHRRFFNAPLRFRADFDGFICQARDLDRATQAADPLMAKYVSAYLDSIIGDPDNDTRDKVWQLVLAMLPTGRCSAEAVADSLGVDRRTIHRHLAQHGETFTVLVDAVRDELATRYLLHDRRRASEVALLLGFSSQSAFSRWFSQRHGCSITAWRAR
ncbi:AraC family transcriptional regulator [Duganella sp. FT3S]|uniref:AraC family transcriptional regulator n=1 Tax=Rugamonas fusca TaxID=2758568 RepID=A0A7W2I9E0_9BURK|nr:AraC family transcriptional regulator [Rugamonas fusca]MBA5608465.1 AraC family transcriptional regulator [Rugamonas fusca]